MENTCKLQEMGGSSLPSGVGPLRQVMLRQQTCWGLQQGEVWSALVRENYARVRAGRGSSLGIYVELPVGEQNAFLDESQLHWVVLLFMGNGERLIVHAEFCGVF